jgi:hypothetical protein
MERESGDEVGRAIPDHVRGVARVGEIDRARTGNEDQNPSEMVFEAVVHRQMHVPPAGCTRSPSALGYQERASYTAT